MKFFLEFFFEFAMILSLIILSSLDLEGDDRPRRFSRLEERDRLLLRLLDLLLLILFFRDLDLLFFLFLLPLLLRLLDLELLDDELLLLLLLFFFFLSSSEEDAPLEIRMAPSSSSSEDAISMGWTLLTFSWKSLKLVLVSQEGGSCVSATVSLGSLMGLYSTWSRKMM